MSQDSDGIPADIRQAAWEISARHLTAGQKDVTTMIADGMLRERRRCVALAQAALGPDVPMAVFIADPWTVW